VSTTLLSALSIQPKEVMPLKPKGKVLPLLESSSLHTKKYSTNENYVYQVAYRQGLASTGQGFFLSLYSKKYSTQGNYAPAA
jgi:hypothetical protein